MAWKTLGIWRGRHLGRDCRWKVCVGVCVCMGDVWPGNHGIQECNLQMSEGCTVEKEALDDKTGQRDGSSEEAD